MKPTVWAITLKGMERDADFGFNKYVWVTKEQGEKILDMQYDDTKKNLLITASGKAFHISDIKGMTEVPLDKARNYASFDRKISEPALLEFNKQQETAKRLESSQRAKLIEKWRA